MNSKKWIPTILGFVIALAVLFGGRIIYQNVRLEQPIQKEISLIEGVKMESIQYDQKKVEITIDIQEVEDFSVTYHEIQEQLLPIIGKRELQLHFKSDDDPTLLHAWKKASFDIAQAVGNKEFSTIPIVIENVQKQSMLDKAGYGLDEENVYIDLHKGKKSLYFVIPREDSQEVNKLG